MALHGELPPLTAERIRAFVADQKRIAEAFKRLETRESPDPPAGMSPAEFALHVGLNARLLHLLSVLGRGTLDDPLQGPRAASAPEIEAVLESLDALAEVFPLPVATVRLRHDPEERRRAEADAAIGRASEREGGALTPDRIRRLLEVLREVAPGSAKLRKVIGDPSVYAYVGVPVEKALGKKVVKQLVDLGEDPGRYFADLTTMRIAAALLRSGRSVSERLAELNRLSDPAVWRQSLLPGSPMRRQAAGFAASAQAAGAVNRQIDPTTEAAVKEMLPEIERELLPYRMERFRRSRSPE